VLAGVAWTGILRRRAAYYAFVAGASEREAQPRPWGLVLPRDRRRPPASPASSDPGDTIAPCDGRPCKAKNR
jgi:hypothetical protein